MEYTAHETSYPDLIASYDTRSGNEADILQHPSSCTGGWGVKIKNVAAPQISMQQMPLTGNRVFNSFHRDISHRVGMHPA